MNMKRFVVGLLLAATVVPWLSCEAREGSKAGERKKPAPNATEQRQKAQMNNRSRAVATHSEHDGFCRDRYCVHASRSRWWPGAPED